MQRGLADSNRWIRPDSINHESGRKVVWRHHFDVAEIVLRRVFGAQLSGPAIDLYGHNAGVRIASGQSERNWSVARTDIDENLVASGGARPIEEQQFRASIDSVSAEHPSIGFQREPDIRQREIDGSAL